MPPRVERVKQLLRIGQTFTVARAPEAVFDYLTDPSKVAEWQTAKTSVESLTDGRPASWNSCAVTSKEARDANPAAPGGPSSRGAGRGPDPQGTK